MTMLMHGMYVYHGGVGDCVSTVMPLILRVMVAVAVVKRYISLFDG